VNQQRFANNFCGLLTAPAAAGASTITISAAQSALLPVLSNGDYLVFTLTQPGASAAESSWELVTVTAVNTATGVMTCSPIQNAWPTGSKCDIRITAAALEALTQLLARSGTLTGSRMLTGSDHGATLVYAGNANISLTLPGGLSAGFSCTVVQAGSGKISFVAGTGGVSFANLGATSGGNTFVTVVSTAPGVFAFQNPTPAGPVTVLLSGIAFIVFSSWTFSANGALSTALALPYAFPAAYCYFPANAIGANVPAGWYYTTFSGVSAGTVYNNTYSSGIPSIPATPIAFTTTAGTVNVQTNTVIQAQNAVLPGGSLGRNGRLRAYALFQSNNSAASKVATLSMGGGQITTFTLSSSNVMSEAAHTTQNTGVQNAQISRAATYNSLSSPPNWSTIDTAADQVLAINLTLATAATGDYLICHTAEFTAEYGA